MSKSVEKQSFYPEDLRVMEVEEEDRRFIIALKSQKHSHGCPECGQGMHSYHGTYKRSMQDLPILGKNVTLRITAYEYYCENTLCSVTTFTEDYEGFVGKSGRMTSRLEAFIRMLALETNCEGGAAICSEMGIRVSGDTIIRLLRKLGTTPMPQSGEHVGIDDFAYRKGHAYCTVICDGETHRPIDIPDGRDGTALREWLRQNKQVKRVTRDRAGVYAKAISDELPGAMQIADRFHLHQNLLNAVKEALKCEMPNRIVIPVEAPISSEVRAGEKSEDRRVIES